RHRPLPGRSAAGQPAFGVRAAGAWPGPQFVPRRLLQRRGNRRWHRRPFRPLTHRGGYAVAVDPAVRRLRHRGAGLLSGVALLLALAVLGSCVGTRDIALADTWAALHAFD